MDPVSLVVSALVAGLAAGVQSTAQQVVSDSYQALKNLIIRKYGQRAGASVEQLELNPKSPGRQAVVEEELRAAGAGTDPELQQLAGTLLQMLDNPRAVAEQVVFEVDLVEQAHRRAGGQIVGQLMNTHIEKVMEVRREHALEDTGLLSKNISQSSSLPSDVRNQITGLHTRIRTTIEQIARRIEEGRYRDAEQALVEMPLAAWQRDRATSLVHADKRMHVSYQALKITVEFFSELNATVLKKIEREGSPLKEADMMLGNAIMIYELTDFVIGYIEGFKVDGAPEVKQLHERMKQEIAGLRRAENLLEQQAMADVVETGVRDQTLEDIKHRKKAIDLLDQEWESYVKEVNQLHSKVDEVHNKLPTLRLIRDNARAQITMLQVVAMLSFLKRNTEAIRGTVDALKGLRLAPLPPDRVRRLIGIG